MGIFDRFPYSSTHEMNLDFMLGKATEIAESLQEIDTHKEQAEQAATNAAQSAQSAAQAAQAAAGSQTAAGTSASQAAQHKADAEDAADRAEAASNLADEAVEHAQAAVTQAQTAADGAIASATAAETRINNLAASLPEDFTDLNNEVTDLKSAIGEYGGIELVQVGYQSGKKFVNSAGVISEASGTYHVSNPIEVKSNDEIHFYAVGNTSNFIMISTCASDGTAISPKVFSKSDGQPHDYVYTAVEDGYIILSFNYSYDYSLTILNNNAPTRLKVDKIDKDGTNEVTAKNIKSTASIFDFESGVEVIPNQYILNYDTSTNKYLFNQKTGYYLIRVDLDVIDCVVTAPEYSWTMTQNYCIACMTDANGVKAGAYSLGNSSPHRYSMIALTSADDVMQIDFAKAKQNYPNAKYYYIGMVGAHDYEWSIKEPHKTLEWLKLTQKQTSEITENMQAELMPVEIILPSKIVAVKGHQLVIFLKNIVICPNLDYYYASAIATGSLIAVSRQYTRFISIKPTADTPVGDYTLTIRVKDKITDNIVAQKQVTISVIADTALTGKKVIFIGDSLTDAKVYPAEIQYNLSGGGLTSIGTRSGNTVINGQTHTVSHEGRTGWSSNDYCTKSIFNGITNAFFNPDTQKFDFSYYMQQQGYSGVDVVCINLGTNSANPYLFDGIITEVNEMIASIHAYDANIKILVSLICPSATQDGFGTAVTIGNGTTGSFDYYQRMIVKRYLEAYDNKIANVGVSPVYVALDTEYDYPTQDVAVTDRNPTVVKRQSNQVHPSVYGYLHMADVYYNTILDLLT